LLTDKAAVDRLGAKVDFLTVGQEIRSLVRSVVKFTQTEITTINEVKKTALSTNVLVRIRITEVQILLRAYTKTIVTVNPDSDPNRPTLPPVPGKLSKNMHYFPNTSPWH
jgi:hypothetical protein